MAPPSSSPKRAHALAARPQSARCNVATEPADNVKPHGRWQRVLAVLLALYLASHVLTAWGPAAALAPPTTTTVALEAHIMQATDPPLVDVAPPCANPPVARSKCPDARDCLRDLVLPTMQQVADQVDFRLSYIGSASNDSAHPVTCMHGTPECLGNMVELCVADIHPDPKIFLGFAMCLSNDYPHIPQQELIDNCALEHQVDTARLDACITRDTGAYALRLLQDSIARSNAVGVKTSCTVRLDNKVRCVRDGGQWKDCAGGFTPRDLVADINRLAHRALLAWVPRLSCQGMRDMFDRSQPTSP